MCVSDALFVRVTCHTLYSYTVMSKLLIISDSFAITKLGSQNLQLPQVCQRKDSALAHVPATAACILAKRIIKRTRLLLRVKQTKRLVSEPQGLSRIR